jgi:hypothetical protein
VQIDALAVKLRPRTAMEAADLGVRLCQHSARSVYACYGFAALPVIVLSAVSVELAIWLPQIVIWWAKPWMDRTILFVLSRAAFGQATTVSDVWAAARQIWGGQWLWTATVHRLSLWRSFTQPVYQLEGVSPMKARARVRQIRRRNMGSAMMMTSAFLAAELCIFASLVSLVFWLAPAGRTPDVYQLFSAQVPEFFVHSMTIAYAIGVAFVEPFFVAAGFAMYLNRRADLEAWDIEQEFRRAFAA